MSELDNKRMARVTDPDTSHENAERLAAGTVKDRVKFFLRDAGFHGLTGSELVAMFPPSQSQSVFTVLTQVRRNGDCARTPLKRGRGYVNVHADYVQEWLRRYPWLAEDFRELNDEQ